MKCIGTAKASRLWILAAIVAAAFANTGCSSSDDDTTGAPTALTVAERVSVVDAATDNAETTAFKPLSIAPALAEADLPADSDYFTDPQRVYVHESSVEVFNMVNEILCMVAQTRYDEMMNAGPYRAQVDANQCSTERDSAESGGATAQNQSSGATSPTFMLFTVDSVRADADSPHIVKAWVHEEASSGFNEMPKLIFAKFVITEGKSDTNPYGLFTMNFAGHPVIDGAVSDTPKFRGFVASERDAGGRVLLHFASEDSGSEAGFHFSEAATLDRSVDGTTGSGSVFREFETPNESGEERHDVSYNETHFLRHSGSDDWCGDRSVFESSTWRYGLYDENGARVTRESGFPIKITRDGSDVFGWVGFWGMWFPADVTVENGDTVVRMDADTEQSYTLFVAGGRLTRHEKKTLTLGEIKGAPLNYHEFNSNTMFRVVWNGNAFMKTGQLDEATQSWENITPVALVVPDGMWSLHFWAQGLGGDGQVQVRDPNDMGGALLPLTDNTLFTFHSNEPVNPGDAAPAALACFDNCPNVAQLAMADPFNHHSGQQNAEPPNAMQSLYTFDDATMLLKDGGGDAVVLTSANDAHPWGVRSGLLFEPTSANYDALRCDWDNLQTCAWQGWERLDVFYTWETGVNQWNRLTALMDGAEFVTFEPPLQVKYTHTGDGFESAVFFLEYSGFGQLHGIPGHCIDANGEEVSCGPNTRWVPAFSIAAGAEVVDANDESKAYLVKPLETEQRMAEVDLEACAGLTTTSFDLPSMADFVAPDIGDEPVVDAPPAVIAGVLQ